MELKGELSQLKDLLRQALKQGNSGEPSTSSQPASAQQSQRQVKGTTNVSDKLHDVDLTQSLESQQADNEDPLEFKTPMTSLHPVRISLTEKLYPPSLKDLTSRQSDHEDADKHLVSVSDESWEQLQQWFAMPESLPIGPTVFTPELAKRVVGPAIWLMNQELDAVMSVFRENTSLRRWKPDRVGFTSHSFTLQIKNAHIQWRANKKKFVFDEPLIAFGKGELPFHGRCR
uniref:Uncharacterized protein n=1 Tax=Noccaea caerulescens TaxID=107243 RepID=A0A1J3DCG1_NOCCA